MSFFKRWKQGIADLPQSTLIRGKLIATTGMILGILFASVYLVIASFWYVTGIMFFSLVLQVIDLISTWKMYSMVRKSEELISKARSSAVEMMKNEAS